MSNIQSNLKVGFFYTAIGKYGNMIIQLVINSILSRLLSPGEYGIVSVVMVFIVFFQLLADMGMGPAIIQNRYLSENDLSSLFNFSIVLALLLSIGFGFFGYIIVAIYRNTIYYSLAWLLAISVFFYSLVIVPNAKLLKNKEFKVINSSALLAAFCGGIVGVVSAINGFGVYALVLSTITNSIINFFLLFYKSSIRVTKNFRVSPLKKIMSFAKNQFGFNFINYFSRNSDNILIGKFIGADALGNYSKAYQLLMYPNNILAGIITPVLQPVLSEHEEDVETIKNVYSKVLHLLALIGMPLSIFLSLSSKQIIFFMFGKQWEGAVLPFTILALTVWVQMLVSSTGAIFQARNKTNYLLIGGIISAVLFITFIILGITQKSIVTVSVALSVAFLFNFLFSFWLLTKKALNTNLLFVFKELGTPFLISLLTGGSLQLYSHYIYNSSFILFLDLICRSIIFVGSLLIGILLFREINGVRDIFQGKNEDKSL